MKHQNKNICLIGLGAIGCAYAAQAADHGYDISIICDPKRKARYQSKSFEINGRDYTFNYISKKEKQAIDLLIISVKSNQLMDALNTVKPFISKKTIIVSLLNGIRSEAIIKETVQTNNIIHAYTIGTDSKKYGHQVTFTKKGKIVLGTPEKEKETMLATAADYLKSIGLPIELSDNIIHEMWWKLMVNVGINQIAALHKIPFRVFGKHEEIKILTRLAMKEVVVIANASNINLTEKNIEEVLELSKSWGPESKASMLQDIENNRKTEVEILGGEICRLGLSLKIPTPVNQFLYHSIKYIETKKKPIEILP